MRSLLLTLPLLAAVGCAFDKPSTTISPESSNGIQGKMYGGQQPVVGATVGVYAMSSTGYGAQPTLLGTTVKTDANGGFTYGSYTCPANNPPVYILGTGGNAGAGNNTAIALTAGIGNCSTAPSVYANINEVTTAATAFALSHFFNTIDSTGLDPFGGIATASERNNGGLVAANLYTIPLLVSIPYGTANASTATVTLESAKLNTIANILASCVNSASSTSANCSTLFTNTTLPDGTNPPTDTLQAAVRMALYPYRNVANLYNLAPPSSPFVGLTAQPSDFTIGASYTSTTLGLSIAGTATSGTSSNIDIDATGRVWLPTNRATAHGVAYFDPATTTFSSVYATSLVTPQYIAIDSTGSPNVYATDTSNSNMRSVSVNFPSATGGSTYTLGGGTSLGPVAITNNANIANAVLFTGQTNAGVALYEIDGGHTTPAFIASYTQMATGLASYTNRSGNNYYEAEAATSGFSTACQLEGSYGDGTQANATQQTFSTSSTTPCITGGAAQMLQGTNESIAVATTANQICDYDKKSCFSAPTALNKPEGIALDGDRNVWIANSGGSSVTTFLFSGSSTYTATSPNPYAHSTTMTAPYGIAIDRSGNVWVSNAGCVNNSATACTPGNYVLSELIGAAAPTLTPLSVQNGTLPTGGSRPLVTGGGQRLK